MIVTPSGHRASASLAFAARFPSEAIACCLKAGIRLSETTLPLIRTATPETDSLARGHPWQNLKPALSASAPDPDMLESTPAFNYISLVAKKIS
jgi:hypothetical protein